MDILYIPSSCQKHSSIMKMRKPRKCQPSQQLLAGHACDAIRVKRALVRCTLLSPVLDEPPPGILLLSAYFISG